MGGWKSSGVENRMTTKSSWSAAKGNQHGYASEHMGLARDVSQRRRSD
jgi:hypothetical protein